MESDLIAGTVQYKWRIIYNYIEYYVEYYVEGESSKRWRVIMGKRYDDGEEIIKALKESYSKRTGKVANIKLPESIQ